MADLPRRAPARVNRAAVTSATGPVKQPEISSELAAAVAAVTTQTGSPASSATPFLTPVQKEMAVRVAERSRRIRYVKFALTAAAALIGVHFAVTRWLYRAPTEAAVHAHVQSLPAAVLPLFSSGRQPPPVKFFSAPPRTAAR